MPSVNVSFPAALTSPEPPVVLDCEAGTVAEALALIGRRIVATPSSQP